MLWLIAAAVAAGAVALVVWARARRTPSDRGDIRVNGRYEPAEIHVESGRPIRLTFHREVPLECSEYVVFPDFGISVMLPPHEPVRVELPPCPPGRHVFTCKHDVFQGLLVVDPPTTRKDRS